MAQETSPNTDKQLSRIQEWYKFQSKIYDLTRWTFLFGRNAIIKKIPIESQKPIKILEVGCGTGKNMVALAKQFPNAHITGLDLSQDMLDVAAKKLAPYKNRVLLLNQPYQKGLFEEKYDVILFAYILTMINPQYDELIHQSLNDLKDEGFVAVVDFHDTKSNMYKKFMDGNHIYLNAQLQPVLEKTFKPRTNELKNGLFGIWRYLLFVGTKK